MMMENREHYLQAAQLYLQASNLILSTVSLQQQIQVCHDELTLLLSLEGTTQDEKTRMRNLKDEIWGCRIELQSVRLKAKRMIKKARYERFADVGACYVQ